MYYMTNVVALLHGASCCSITFASTKGCLAAMPSPTMSVSLQVRHLYSLLEVALFSTLEHCPESTVLV